MGAIHPIGREIGLEMAANAAHGVQVGRALLPGGNRDGFGSADLANLVQDGSVRQLDSHFVSRPRAEQCSADRRDVGDPAG